MSEEYFVLPDDVAYPSSLAVEKERLEAQKEDDTTRRAAREGCSGTVRCERKEAAARRVEAQGDGGREREEKRRFAFSRVHLKQSSSRQNSTVSTLVSWRRLGRLLPIQP